MTTLARAIVQLDGWDGGPGVNVWTFSSGTGGVVWDDTDLAQIHSDLAAGYNVIDNYIQGGINITIPNVYDLFDVNTGNIVDQRVHGTQTVINTGGGKSAVSRATQVCLGLVGDKYIAGRRVRGRKFFGPANSLCVDSATGLVASSAVTAFESAFEGMLTGLGPRVAVYRRPTSKGGADGDYADVGSFKVMRKPSVLRSRRD